MDGLVVLMHAHLEHLVQRHKRAVTCHAVFMVYVFHYLAAMCGLVCAENVAHELFSYTVLKRIPSSTERIECRLSPRFVFSYRITSFIFSHVYMLISSSLSGSS